ncbi:MAG TPA: TldD/PmbA family protein [Acidimicrobiales bacterium]|nr:TldD/PmbA family protein [Acidimicrobiales bacterium]
MLDPAVLRRTLSTALRTGGEFAEVFVEDKRTSSARLDDGRVEELTSGRDRGAGIRVVVGDTTGFAHTSDLSEQGLEQAAGAAAAAARSGGGGVRTVALTPTSARRPYEPRIAPEDVAKPRKVDLLLRADHAARSASGAGAVKQVSAAYVDAHRRIQVANSDGLLAADDVVRTRFGVTAVAVGDTGMQTGYEAVARSMGFEIFDDVDVDEVAAKATARALAKLAARPAPSGKVPVVIAAGRGAVLFHEACGHGLEADHIEKRSSVYHGRVGEMVASPHVTLVDDGTMGSEWGAFAIDDEGRPAQRNVLIENGMLTDYMWDFLRSRKAARPSSGNGRRQSYQDLPMVRMTNTYLLGGTEDADEIVRQTPHGVYVASMGGGQVTPATGDFVFGMTEAYLIEDGEITHPLRDANLIGNGPAVLRNIDAVAGDFAMASSGGMCGKNGQSVPVGMGQPTLRITGVTVGGTAR